MLNLKKYYIYFPNCLKLSLKTGQVVRYLQVVTTFAADLCLVGKT